MGQKHGQCSKRKEKGSKHLKHGTGEEHGKFLGQRKLKMKKYRYLRMREHKTIWKTIRKGTKKWIRHIITRNNEWITTIIERKVEEKLEEIDQEHHL